MKKFMMTLLSVIAVLSIALSCVFAEPENDGAETTAPEAVQEEAANVEESESLPIEEETAELPPPQLELVVNLDSSSQFTQKVYVSDEDFERYKYMQQTYQQMENMIFEMNEEGGNKYILQGEKTDAGDPITMSGYRFAKKPGFFGTTYFLSAGYDFRTSTEDVEKEDANIVGQLTAKLPVGASFSDADLKENGGKTLVWNIKEGKYNSIGIMFTIPNITNIVVVIAIVVILIIAAILIIMSKMKKKQLTDAEIVDDALNNIEGRTESDEFVDDPFASMTDEEINSDITEDDSSEETVSEDSAEEPESTEDNE